MTMISKYQLSKSDLSYQNRLIRIFFVPLPIRDAKENI
jgi:hypothetical protein